MDRQTKPDNSAAQYREFLPPSALGGHLLCLWTETITGGEDEFAQSVLPDACIDIVLINDQAPLVVGPWTDPFVARFSAGTTIVGARFHPGAAPSLLGLPASELLNQSPSLSAIWGSKASRRFERIADERALPARLSAIGSALIDLLAIARPIDEETRAAIRWFVRHPNGRMKELSHWMGFSSRQLQRRFSTAVGYGPKLFQSVLRFQRLLHLSAHTDTLQSLAQLSADAGYADQAHMTREFRRFSGGSPTMLLRSARCGLRLSDLLNASRNGDR
jgi:AraC-like DNA-binding protein